MTESVFGEFCWNELATPDVKQAKDFYGKVFGWQFKDLNMGDMNYTIIKSKDKEFAGIWQIPAEQQDKIPPHWIAYILVADVASALEKAKLHGAKVKKEISQAGDMGRFAIIADPSGAYIALWQALKK